MDGIGAGRTAWRRGGALFRRALGGFVAALLLAGAPSPGQEEEEEAPVFPPATPERLPRWRGFNLLEKFRLESGNRPFAEADFRRIADWGFNFVRLPMDYRLWIVDGDPEQFDENVLREIDAAIAWGERYGIHVCLNLHRAPGYTVARPAEEMDLWTDEEAQRLTALHWAMFARRYRGIPSERLSFNPVNEPDREVEPAAYAYVMARVAEAIREEDPARLIILDGLEFGTRPAFEALHLDVAQFTRGYAPFPLTHYRAPWVPGADDYPPPHWPVNEVNGFLYGPMKAEFAEPLRIEGPFPEAVRLRIRVGVVSIRARLRVRADGRTVFERVFDPRAGEGEWEESVYRAEWAIYQNRFDLDVFADIPADTQEVEIDIAEGDWLTVRELGLRPAAAPGRGEARLAPGQEVWGGSQVGLAFDAERHTLRAESETDRALLWEDYIRPWQALEAQRVGVMVGEWGAYHRTPHDVVLRWMEDCLRNWEEAGWGWALWNLRGPFGVLDSGREDVDYERFEGHRLDRRMLELLQRY